MTKMSTIYENPHSACIDKRCDKFITKDKWRTKIIDTSHDVIIEDISSHICTDVILVTFTKSYLKKHPCSDCKKPSKERCHGIGEERPILLKRALERVYPDTTKVITLREILIAFLKEHKTTKFTFKCSECHKKETSKNTVVSSTPCTLQLCDPPCTPVSLPCSSPAELSDTP